MNIFTLFLFREYTMITGADDDEYVAVDNNDDGDCHYDDDLDNVTNFTQWNRKLCFWYKKKMI